MAGKKTEAKGKLNKVAGGTKKSVGRVTKNRKLEAKGVAQKTKRIPFRWPRGKPHARSPSSAGRGSGERRGSGVDESLEGALQGFRQRGVRVDRVRGRAQRHATGHHRHDLVDHRPGLLADHVPTEELAGPGIRDELHETVGAPLNSALARCRPTERPRWRPRGRTPAPPARSGRRSPPRDRRRSPEEPRDSRVDEVGPPGRRRRCWLRTTPRG